MADKQVRIDLVASDKASAKVEDLAEDVERLEKLDPEVEVTADTRQAQRALEDLSDEARELAAKDQEVVLKAKIGDARAALRDLQGDLDRTASDAKRTEEAVDDIGRAQGPRLAGNTVADLTGPLGEASGVASDVGGVFDGLSDSAEKAWLQMGGGEAGAARVAGILGGLGFAVSGAVAAWSYFRQQQQKAREEQKRLIEGQEKLNDLLAKREFRDAATEMIELYSDAYDQVGKFGITVEEVTAHIQGQSEGLGTLTEAMDEQLAKQGIYTGQVLETVEALRNARVSYQESNTAIATQTTLVDKVATQLGKAKRTTEDLSVAQDRVKRNTERLTDAMDRLRGSLDMERALLRFTSDFQAAHDKVIAGTELTSDEILSLKEDVLDVAAYAKLNPVEVKSLLDRIDNKDYLGVKTDVEAQAAANPPGVETKLLTPSDLALQQWLATIQRRINAMGGRVYVPGGGFVQPSSAAAASSTVNVTQNVPRGYHGDLLAQARTAARRSGGLYHRNRR